MTGSVRYLERHSQQSTLESHPSSAKLFKIFKSGAGTVSIYKATLNVVAPIRTGAMVDGSHP